MVAERIAARFRIRGRVQGVAFRAATRREAQQLDLHGYAVNQPDGSVEVLVEGNAAAVERLADWLQHGPALARVDRVEREAAVATGRAGFGVG
jgi:acylphosphatase